MENVSIHHFKVIHHVLDYKLKKEYIIINRWSDIGGED